MFVKALKRAAPACLKRAVKDLLGIQRLELRIQRLEEIQRAVGARRTVPIDATPINVSLFRLEGKTADERTAAAQSRGLRVETTPADTYPFTNIRIETAKGVFAEPLHYSHLGLLKLVTEYDFDSILDIGSRSGTSARAFVFLGKEVTTVEIVNEYGATFRGDYLDAKFGKQFDAIWCSHVLEHQRHLGRFCEKMFDDLKESGVLAVTVPTALSPLIMGHCNIFTPLHLLYHLILAGFDCSSARVKCYDWQMTVLLRKKPNYLPHLSFAISHHANPDADRPVLGHHPEIISFFPSEVAKEFTPDGHIWGERDAIAWD